MIWARNLKYIYYFLMIWWADLSRNRGGIYPSTIGTCLRRERPFLRASTRSHTPRKGRKDYTTNSLSTRPHRTTRPTRISLRSKIYSERENRRGGGRGKKIPRLYRSTHTHTQREERKKILRSNKTTIIHSMMEQPTSSQQPTRGGYAPHTTHG